MVSFGLLMAPISAAGVVVVVLFHIAEHRQGEFHAANKRRQDSSSSSQALRRGLLSCNLGDHIYTAHHSFATRHPEISFSKQNHENKGKPTKQKKTYLVQATTPNLKDGFLPQPSLIHHPLPETRSSPRFRHIFTPLPNNFHSFTREIPIFSPKQALSRITSSSVLRPRNRRSRHRRTRYLVRRLG